MTKQNQIDILTRQGRENWIKVGYEKAMKEQQEKVEKLKKELGKKIDFFIDDFQTLIFEISYDNPKFFIENLSKRKLEELYNILKEIDAIFSEGKNK